MCVQSDQSSGQTNTTQAGLTGAATGAAAGATLGSVVPGVGTLIGGVVGALGGAATSILGSQANNKSAKQVEEQRRIAQENAIIETRRRATNDYLRQTQLEMYQAKQEQEAVAEKSFDIDRQTGLASGTAVASAAERGVDGRSLETILNDYNFQNSLEVGRLNLNQQAKDRQHQVNIEGYGDQFTQRAMNQQPYLKQAVAPVDYFTPIFGMLGNLGKIGMASGVGQNKTTPTNSSGIYYDD